MQGVQQQGVQPNVQESNGSTSRGTAGPFQAARDVTASGASGVSPAVTVVATADRSAIIVQAADS